MSTTVIRRADVAVYSPNGKLQVIVEVKNKRGASPEWAMGVRRNLYAHSLLPDAPYFLLALPERFYLWDQSKPTDASAAPDYEISAESALADYIDDLPTFFQQLNEHSFEVVIASWLASVATATLTRETAQPHERWLLESGLYDAVKNGEINIEAAV